MSFAEAQLAAHGVACFCRVLHCQAVLLEWNLDVKCFTMAWSLWTLRVWLKVKKSAARLLLFTVIEKAGNVLNGDRQSITRLLPKESS